MANPIFPCLWFDGTAKDAADFYCSIFPDSKITVNTPMVVQFTISGQRLMGLNGGPTFKMSPSISMFVTCETDTEIEDLYAKLIDGGSAMMALDKYPWAEKYGWVTDKFGMTWQLMKDRLLPGISKIHPSFLFVGNQFGHAVDAVNQFTTIFPNSKVHHLEMGTEVEGPIAGTLKFGHFNLGENLFAAMDGLGEHKFEFNEGVSLMVECDTQEEIDKYWNQLVDGGNESRCGWLKDRFGISWQIVPANMGKFMTDPTKSKRVMDAIMKMKKIEISELENA